MLGIPDPGIWLAYLLAALCVIFAIWFSAKYWNEEDKND
jgi:TRAP-type C4-dicarboxylate transport system permease small subunit